jgi:N-acetyl-anhydromuramyl-L-alanine amidase AmpD
MTYNQAKHYKNVGGIRKIDLIVIHDMEAPEKGTTAETIANMFHVGNVVASAHYCIDCDSIVQCVNDMDVAYHAPGANSNGIGLEHAGYARQSTAEWQDEFSLKMLHISAKLTAELCVKYKIPAVWLSSADLLAGKRGITSHVNVNGAFHKSSHTDPGVNFPKDLYIKLVWEALAAMNAVKNPPTPTPPKQLKPVLKLGSKGTAVVEWQQKMNRLAGRQVLKVDGDFGGTSEKATRDFQTWNKVKSPLGVVDQNSWDGMDLLLWVGKK